VRGAADTDGDGKVTLDELYEYVYEQVEREARRIGGSMNPVRKGTVQGTVYITEVESQTERQVRLARDAGASMWHQGNLDEAERQWRLVQEHAPGDDEATRSLAAIAARRAEQDDRRAAEDRERSAAMRRRHRTLLEHSKSGALSMTRYNRAMELVDTPLESLDDGEREERRFLDSLLAGELSLSAYIKSLEVLESSASLGGVALPQVQLPAEAASERPRHAVPDASPSDRGRRPILVAVALSAAALAVSLALWLRPSSIESRARTPAEAQATDSPLVRLTPDRPVPADPKEQGVADPPPVSRAGSAEAAVAAQLLSRVGAATGVADSLADLGDYTAADGHLSQVWRDLSVLATKAGVDTREARQTIEAARVRVRTACAADGAAARALGKTPAPCP